MRFVSLDDAARRSGRDGAGCRKLYGGKGFNLARLIDADFCVPSGFIITTDIFEHEMLTAIAREPSKGAVDVALNVEFSAAFEAALRTALEETPGRMWAVRSSSTDEDSQAHSFAGLQESVIGVSSFDACLDAIRKVWASFYAKERLLYPSQASLIAEVPAMAVVIQGFVDSDAAGVIFTHHPFEGKRAMLINVSRGQGERVVNGKGGESINIDRSRSGNVQSECLDPDQITELVETAEAIERTFGAAQDIEFSFSDGCLYILQARDIVKHGEEKHILYSNVNVGEALSGVCTPMTWSVGMAIAERGFETIFSTFGLSVPPKYQFVTTFDGHIYINVSELLSVASQVPFIDSSILARIAGIKRIGEYIDIVEPMSRRHFIHHLPRSLARLVSMQNHLRYLPERAEAFCRQRDELLAFDIDAAPHEEMRIAFSRLHTLFLDCGFDMLGAGASFLASYTLCSAFLDKFDVQRDESLESYLFSGLLDVPSAAPGLALMNMAGEIREFPELARAFTEENDFDDAAAFRKGTEFLPGGKHFWNRFDDFLIRYGARANQEAELANARWREDPRFLFRVIGAHLKSPTPAKAQTIVDASSAARETRTDEFRSMLSRSLRPFFRSLLGWAQKNARLREEWRAYVVDVLGLFRKFFLAAARKMVRQGILDNPDDVFFLTYEEFHRWLGDTNALNRARLLVSFRRARHEAYLSARTLPDTFVTHPNQCGEDTHFEQTRVLYGLPASPGCVRARVRVARTLEEASKLEYGEILVTTTTDVGWTPLFLIASAILTERGGPLSHAFVVAREYGVPAVVSVPHLLEALKTGDIVTVSGQKGIVSISQ